MLFGEQNRREQDSAFISAILRIIELYKGGIATKAIEYLETLDRRILKIVYSILCKYRTVLHLDETFLSTIEQMLRTKFAKDEWIVLHPTVSDLFNANLYRLKVNGQQYIVPLWHQELVYDGVEENGKAGTEIFVECVPKLPANVSIDEKNNVHIKITRKLSDIWQADYIEFVIDDTYDNVLQYPVSGLNMVRKQTRVLVGHGIPLISTVDMYDITKRSDVYIHLEIIR
jgi:hypothetical protein